MNNASISPSSVGHYFVDEAGDPNLFNRKKRIVVGNDGCSSSFIVGKIDVSDPSALASDMEDLRKALLADPYFKNVPSMQLDRQKTALAFHATDDLPEVRREVFKLLSQHDVRFYALVRDKCEIVRKVLEFNKRNPHYRYHPNQLYDRCVARLFKDRLHLHDGYTIRFAKRGSSDRTEALQNAIEAARRNFRISHGIVNTVPIEIVPSDPREDVCLQAVDYFLWSLQRFYERDEERYLHLMWNKVGCIHDVDDTRNAAYGTYYTQSNQLSLEDRA